MSPWWGLATAANTRAQKAAGCENNDDYDCIYFASHALLNVHI